jgi:hypothetical protein
MFLAGRSPLPASRGEGIGGCFCLILLGKFDGRLYIVRKMKNLTRQEQFVLCLILLLLLTGWAVKVYRTAHAPMRPTTQQRP